MKIEFFVVSGTIKLAITIYFIFCIPETFRNCADIAITSNTGGIPPLFVSKSNPFLLYYRDYRAPEENNVFPLVVR